MSFRKRGEIISGLGEVKVAPGREPGGHPSGRFPTNRGLASIKMPMAPPRGVVPSPAAGMAAGQRTPISVAAVTKELDIMKVADLSVAENHPGIRPSPATSQQTTSTGSQDVDKLLGHMGLPLGQSLLIEEQTTTDFASILAKSFASQGVIHNRVEGGNAMKNGNTHLVLFTLNKNYARELPGVFKGSKKEVKRSKISEEESRVTVQNLAGTTSGHQPTRYQDLKIAWRYGLVDEEGKSKVDVSDSETYPHYNHQFDTTSRLLPAPTSAEVSYISPIQPVKTILKQLEAMILNSGNKLLRILIPNLLNPVMYPPKLCQLQEVMPLLHGIRALVKKYSHKCVLFTTISTDLFKSHTGLFLNQIETLFDSILILEPFNQEMLQFLEKACKSQPNKVQHGLVHIKKLPVFSERGEMHLVKSEWAFKNGRKKFAIEEWSIPVEDGSDDQPQHRTDPGSGANYELNSAEHTHQHSPSLDF
ncbi:Elongator subunit ELP4 Ecym_7073 [Eremothecium cymbalariae DBVPG|uniref:Elongator complex protein 4 n=1 Tax=Eremothecium cymbalariae (strain CBS 270.75 / DBVPG 7215 / KCTC 17166 / NRRL Y-17582) TaxID=931890 RepID=G8JVR1_ERECY|nr:hypothetical protein Ecym_7073 [Eremothecium cymbalariae DBVPG\